MTLRQVLPRIPLYAFILFLGCVAAEFIYPGVKIVLQNDNPEAMTDVVVTVHASGHALGTLAPGESGVLWIRQRGASSVEIEYVNGADRRVQLDAGAYVFSGFRAHLPVRIRDDRIVEEDEDGTGAP